MERVTYFTVNLTTLSVAEVIQSQIMINVTIINASHTDRRIGNILLYLPSQNFSVFSQ